MLKYDRWSILAVLRFWLAFIVAINHLAEYTSLGWLAIVPKFGAFEAILGFLLISGYSISLSHQKQPKGFLLRRAFRIYPVYLGALALGCFATDLPVNPAELIQNILFLNQITTPTSLVGPAWSLALEFWLYCLTPWLAQFSIGHLRRLTYLSFAAYCVYTCGRTLFHWPYFSGVGYGLNIVYLSFAWLAGFALGRATENRGAILREVGLFFAGHITLATCIQLGYRFKNSQSSVFFRDDLLVYVFQAATLALTWYVFYLITNKRTGATVSQRMRNLGDISYPLYLVHIPVGCCRFHGHIVKV